MKNNIQRVKLKLHMNLENLNETQFKNADAFYRELTTRNKHFVTEENQKRLRSLKVFIAGCGAAGGACIEPLVRLGVTRFRLADNGTYDLSNLNRQHTFVDKIGENKATFHAQEALRINPFADVIAFPEGVTSANLMDLVKWADLVIDAVDVTVQESIQMKFHLHEVAKEFRKPTVSPLDPGFCQMGQAYDYRNPKMKTLGGKLDACKSTKDPIQGLMTMFPMNTFPTHSLQLVIDLLEKPQPASQLGCSADLLSGVIAAVVLKFASSGELAKGWRLDVAPYALSRKEQNRNWWAGFALRRKIKKLMKS